MFIYFILLSVLGSINAYYAGYRISSFYNPDTDYKFFVYLGIHAVIGYVLMRLANWCKYNHINKILNYNIVISNYSLQTNNLIYEYCKYQTKAIICYVDILFSLITLYMSYAISIESLLILGVAVLYNSIIYFANKFEHQQCLNNYIQHLKTSESRNYKPDVFIQSNYYLRDIEVKINSFVFLAGYLCTLGIYFYLHTCRANIEPQLLPTTLYKLMFIMGKCSAISKLLNISLRNKAYSKFIQDQNLIQPKISEYRIINFLLTKTL